MVQFLFDSDYLTLYHHQHPPLLRRLALLPPDSVAICPINIEESMRGWLAPLGRVLAGPRHVKAYADLADAEALFRRFPLVPFDAASETEFQHLRAARLNVGTLDLKIAPSPDERPDGSDAQSEGFRPRSRIDG